MPRIYKPVGPSANKAVKPATETKGAAPAKEEKPQKSNEKKDGGQ